MAGIPPFKREEVEKNVKGNLREEREEYCIRVLVDIDKREERAQLRCRKADKGSAYTGEIRESRSSAG